MIGALPLVGSMPKDSSIPGRQCAGQYASFGDVPGVGGMPNVGAMPKGGHFRCAMWRCYAAGLSEFDIGAQRRQLIVIVGLRR